MMKIEGKYLTVFSPAIWSAGYDIPVSELKTESGLERWVCHMTEKNWFSVSMARELVRLCEEKFGYSYGGKLKY